MQAPSFYQQLKVLLALEVISFCFLGHFGLLLCTELRFVVSIYKFKYVNSLLSLLNPIFKKKKQIHQGWQDGMAGENAYHANPVI